jgi:hypothetical protein
MKKILLCLVIALLTHSFTASAQQVTKIPDHYFTHKHFHTTGPHEQVFHYLTNEEQKAAHTIYIPAESLDTGGLTDISDTLQYYIDSAARRKNTGNNIYKVIIPPGTFLLLNTINIPAQIAVFGTEPEKTIINCKVGENKHCFEIKSENTNPLFSIPLFDSYAKGTGKFVLSKDTINKYWIDQSKSYDMAIVKKNDSNYITSDWAKGTVKEHFFSKISSYQGDENKRNIEMHLKNWADVFSDYVNYGYFVKTALRYDSSELPTLQAYEMVYAAGLACLTINRLDTTASQTSNILLHNAKACFIKAVISNHCHFAHITLNNSKDNIIKRCHLSNGHDHGSGGKAYGVVLQQGSAHNSVFDNVLYRLRHGVLLQSGANHNVITANYSYEPYWTGTALPSDAAGDIVLHGNFPFSNLIELNMAEQIVLDDSHGKNGPFNIFHRNHLNGYGIVMSVANGSDSQVFTGNEIVNENFPKGLFVIQDTGHFMFGNKIKTEINPQNTGTNLEKFIALRSYRGEELRRTFYQSNPYLFKSWIPPFGEPFNQKGKSIYAFDNKNSAPLCLEFTDSFWVANIEEINQNKPIKLIAYPNPSEGEFRLNLNGQLKVYDLKGCSIDEFELDEPNHPFVIRQKGLFILRLSHKGKTYVTKVIVQ